MSKAKKNWKRRCGAPRKDGGRWPNGRLKLVVDTDPTEWQMQQRKSFVGSQAEDPRAGYALGILNLKGVLTERQHEAGDRYFLLHSAWRHVEGLPPPSARSMLMGEVRSRAAPSVSVLTKWHLDTLDQHQEATDVLRGVGVGVLAAVDALALFDEISVNVEYVERGLDALADYFRLPKGKP